MITRNGRLAGRTIWSTLKGNVGTGSPGAATFDAGRGDFQALTYLRKDIPFRFFLFALLLLVVLLLCLHNNNISVL